MSDLTESILWKKGYRVNSKGEWYKPTAPELSHPVQEPHLRHEAVKADAPKESSPSCSIRMVITSYRVRLCDIDNLEVKFLIDALRYAGIIVNDSPRDIVSLTVQQAQVRHFIDEHTDVQITVGEYRNSETSDNPPSAAGSP